MVQFPVMGWAAQITARWFERLKNRTKSSLRIPRAITRTLIWVGKYAQFARRIMLA